VARELLDKCVFLELYLEGGRGMLAKEKLFAVLKGSSFRWKAIKEFRRSERDYKQPRESP